MTLSGAEKYIKDNKHALRRDVQILDYLGKIRATLLEIKSELGSESSDTEIVVGNEALAEAVNASLGEAVSVEAELDRQQEEAEAQAAKEETAAAPQPEGGKPRYIEPTLFDL